MFQSEEVVRRACLKDAFDQGEWQPLDTGDCCGRQLSGRYAALGRSRITIYMVYSDCNGAQSRYMLLQKCVGVAHHVGNTKSTNVDRCSSLCCRYTWWMTEKRKRREKRETLTVFVCGKPQRSWVSLDVRWRWWVAVDRCDQGRGQRQPGMREKY